MEWREQTWWSELRRREWYWRPVKIGCTLARQINELIVNRTKSTPAGCILFCQWLNCFRHKGMCNSCCNSSNMSTLFKFVSSKSVPTVVRLQWSRHEWIWVRYNVSSNHKNVRKSEEHSATYTGKEVFRHKLLINPGLTGFPTCRRRKAVKVRQLGVQQSSELLFQLIFSQIYALFFSKKHREITANANLRYCHEQDYCLSR